MAEGSQDWEEGEGDDVNPTFVERTGHRTYAYVDLEGVAEEILDLGQFCEFRRLAGQAILSSQVRIKEHASRILEEQVKAGGAVTGLVGSWSDDFRQLEAAEWNLQRREYVKAFLEAYNGKKVTT